MKRRDFLTASAIAATVPMSQQSLGADEGSSEKEYLELRHYEFSSAEKQRAFEAFLGKAFIPALNRQGIRPVGVFKAGDEKEGAGLWVLIPHNRLESVITCNTKMLSDPTFTQAGGDILNCPKSDPAYTRFESSLLLGFDACSKVEVPTKKETRIFQLRIYESHNAIKAKRKVEMFNAGGEIALFRLVGLNPVFFGESIIGSKMPNLTYMLGFDDADAHKKAWETFIKHPEWKKMSSDPYYEDTVSNITNLVLRPSASSQI
jgi:hypothetical protein